VNCHERLLTRLAEIARRTAQFLGVNFHKTHMSEQVLAENFEAATWHNEHTMPDLNYIGKFVLSRAPAEHGVKVVLTGEGADEHFGGYPTFLSDYLAEADQSWPGYNLDEAGRDAIWNDPKHQSSQEYSRRWRQVEVDQPCEHTTQQHWHPRLHGRKIPQHL
jgi:asparagine synthase (glutamine-hydrolysing)